jgi:hypothetical protein
MRALTQASFVTANVTRKCTATAGKTKEAVWAVKEGRRECRQVAAKAYNRGMSKTQFLSEQGEATKLASS